MTILSLSLPAVGLVLVAYAFAGLVFHLLRPEADATVHGTATPLATLGSGYVEAGICGFAAGAVPLVCLDSAGLFPSAAHLPQHLVLLLLVLIAKAAFATHRAHAQGTVTA